MAARTKHDREDDRRTILAALTDADAGLTIEQLLRDAWGLAEPAPTYLFDRAARLRQMVVNGQWIRRTSHMRTDLRALERAGKIVGGRATPGAYAITYRLATLDDIDAESDDREVRRMLSQWEPADD